MYRLSQNDSFTIDETGNRRQSTQGDNHKSHIGDPASSAQALETQSCLSVRIYVATLGIRQLYAPDTQIFQSERSEFHRN